MNYTLSTREGALREQLAARLLTLPPDGRNISQQQLFVKTAKILYRLERRCLQQPFSAPLTAPLFPAEFMHAFFFAAERLAAQSGRRLDFTTTCDNILCCAWEERRVVAALSLLLHALFLVSADLRVSVTTKGAAVYVFITAGQQKTTVKPFVSLRDFAAAATVAHAHKGTLIFDGRAVVFSLPTGLEPVLAVNPYAGQEALYLIDELNCLRLAFYSLS